MKKREQNRLSMWRAVRRHLDDNASIWNSNDPFRYASDMLSGAIAAAWNANQRQKTGSVGVSTARVATEAAAIRQVMKIACSAKPFARDTGNDELLHALRYGKGALEVMAQTDLISTLGSMVEAARPHAEALVTYGTRPEAYDKALDTISALEAKQTDVRTAITSRKAVTASIASITAAATQALKRLDDLVFLYEDDHPEFAAGYKTARGIFHTATRSPGGDAAAA